MNKTGKKYRVLIATGIYPPQVGGPSFYAKGLKDAFSEMGHSASVVTYGWLRFLPTGVRHILFFIKMLPFVPFARFVIILDTFSVGLPAVIACKVFGKKSIIRTGGDFIWEQYVERTGNKILLSEFYKKHRKFSSKEEKIFRLTKFVFRNASSVVFSTEYQRDIFLKPYKIDKNKTRIIENYYGPTMKDEIPDKKNFVCFVRNLKLKNLDTLEKAFTKARRNRKEITVEIEHTLPHGEMLRRLRKCYAAILVSISEVSPNFVIEALMYGKPVIVSKENGIVERIKDHVILVDPLDEGDIRKKILYLSEPENYELYRRKALTFGFRHSYKEIASEFISAYEKL